MTRMMILVVFLLFSTEFISVKCKLQIHGGHKIKLVEGSSAAIDVSYTNTGIQSLSCVIKSENDIVLSGTINTLHKNGTVDITPADTGQLVFGSYMVVFAVFNGTVEVDSTTALLLYERELAGLTVTNPVNTLINGSALLSASLQRGSGAVVEWIINDSTEVTYSNCNGSIDTIETVMSFPSAKTYQVTLLIVNSFGDKLSGNIDVHAWMPVKGFSITAPNVVGVNENITYTIKLDSDARLPMGNISYNVSYGDGKSKSNAHISNPNLLITTGLAFKHVYTQQGNYDVVVHIYTELSYQTLNYTCNIWNPILLPSANEFVEVFKNTLFDFKYTSATPFHYYIAYGDGTTKNSSHDIVTANNPLDISEWNKAFNKSGVYDILFEAWNDFYVSICNYTVKVQNPIPPLILTPKEEDPLLKFPATTDLNITLSMANTDDLLPTNMSCFFCFDTTNCSNIIDVDFTTNGSIVLHHAYSENGTKNITAHCFNNISSSVTQTRIEILPKIQGFAMSNGFKFDLKPGDSITAAFTYLKGVELSVRAKIMSNSNIVVNGMVNEGDKTGSVTFDDTNIGSLSYGTYKVILELLSTSGEMREIVIALFYEEPITNLIVRPKEFLLLQMKNTEFDVSKNTGSNEETEIIIKGTESVLVLCQDQVPQYSVEYSYGEAINYTVSAISRNSVSGTSSEHYFISVMKRVRGFEIEVLENPIDSYTYASIRITLDREDRLPMHDLTLYLDFGDDSNTGSINFDYASIQKALSPSGYLINHTYTKQGNITIEGFMESVLNRLSLTTYVWVWDNLTYVTLDSASSARVGDVIDFNFEKATKSGFKYNISYGDGHFNGSIQVPDILYKDYYPQTFHHSYDEPDVYEVFINIWNSWYSKTQYYLIIIQHPIVDFHLNPQAPIQYPIPDGQVLFSINMTNNHPDPTNVTCQFIFENAIVHMNISVDITFTRPYIWTHNYTTNGTKDVQVNCSNIVSNVILTTQIDIMSVELEDFTFIYQHVVPMNITLEENDGQEKVDFPAADVPVKVEFRVELFKCVRFPPEVSFTWDFGDNSQSEVNNRNIITHVYKDRRKYNWSIIISNNTNVANKFFEIKLGAVDFNVSTFLGGVLYTKFDFSMTGLNGTYELYPFNNNTNKPKSETDKTEIVHLYNIYDYGKFRPKIVASCENFTEILYFDKPIVVDYNTSVMEVSMPSSVKMPEPGDVNVTASLKSTTIPLPFMQCTYDMQDFINYTVVNITQNITADNPIIFNFEYLTLGEHDVTVNCSNKYDNILRKSVIEVTNKCFTIDGIFDRQYARPTNPMKAYTTENFDLTNRMGVHCSNETIVFNWSVYNVDSNGKKIKKMKNDDNNGNRGSYRFSKGKFPEGLYEVFLNVSLASTWIPERTYIEFVRADPKAFIEGGFERTIKHSNKFVLLDALTSSYDVAYGYGYNQNLTFSWNCIKTQANDLEKLADMYTEGNYGKTKCDILETSRGFANLTFDGTIDLGYIVTANVTLDNVYASYTQLLLTVSGNGPDVYIRCMRLNCDVKYAVKVKSIWDVVCTDCVGIASYHWSLKKWSGTLWETEPIINTTTGVLKTSLDILEDSLEEGNRYRIEVTVTDSNGVGEAKWEVKTNYLPYGGVCKATNKSVVGRPPSADQIVQEDVISGFAFSTRFAVYCFNWKDEGERQTKNELLDNKFDKPLMYEYVIKQSYKGDLLTEQSTETTLYKGGESTATELRLPASSEIELFVKVIDRFGDYTTQSWKLNISVNDSLEPRDIERAQSLFEVYDLSRNVTKSGGNNVGVLQMISSTASMYNNLTLGNQTIAVSSDQSSVSEEESGEELKLLVQKKTREFVEEMATVVPPNSSLTILPAVAQLVASTMDEVISNKEVLSQVASEGVTNTTYEVLTNIKRMLQLNPIPMQELDAMLGGARDSEDVISKNLEFINLDSVEDVNQTLTYEKVKADIMEDIYYKKVDPDTNPLSKENIEAEYQRRLRKRNLQLERANSTEKTTMKLLKSIDTINDVNSIKVATGQGDPVIQELDNVYFSVEKDTVESFVNKSSIKRKDFTFDFGNGTFNNISDGNVQLQVSVLDKSPILHAGGASKVRSKIVRFVAKKFIDQNQEEEQLDLPLSMSIDNENVPEFTEFDKTNFEDEVDDMMHFRTQVQDEQDAIIIYFKPKGIDEDNKDAFNITVKATAQITSTVGENQYETNVSPDSLTEYGFKVFIPEGTFKQGDVIISFKILKAINETEANKDGLSRRKRSVFSYPSSSNYTFTNASVGIITTGCRVFDEGTNSWTSKGCSILPTSTINETRCYCAAGSGSIFTSSFFKPNMIDFHSVWSMFDPNNAAVYGTITALIVIYILGLVYLRRKDKLDQVKWIPVLLCDNKKYDDYFYMISVYTGIRPGAGTKSNVSFILGGEDGDSGIRLMSDGSTTGLESKTVKSFIMSTSNPLGGLTYLRIWHDSSGEGDEASWYLHKIVVEDLHSNDRFVFLSDQWLALDMDDGMIERLLPVLDKENAGFESVFSQETRTNLTDNHLWLSIVVRPQRSLFTRVQRLSCLMSLLMLTMITNAMFFKSDDEETVTADTVRIGAFRLSLRTAYISVVGVIITVPPLLFITHLFKNARVKRKVSKNSVSGDIGRRFDEIEVIEEAKLPHWCVYIAWLIVALSILIPAFFLILYSMKWGKDKSEEWLTTFVLSFLESLLVVDPLKVLLIALIIAWVFKTPSEDKKLSVDLDAIKYQCSNITEKDSTQFSAFRMEIMSKSGPPVEDILQHRRAERLKEKIAQRAFVELVLQVVFAVVIFSISYINRDVRAYQLKSNIYQHLYVSTKNHSKFDKVNSQESFLNWTKDTLVPFMFPTARYNNGPLDYFDKRYVSDMNNLRVGTVRLRQVRSENVTCNDDRLTDGRLCVPEYDTDNEQRGVLQDRGLLLLTPGAWSHTSSDKIWGISIMGVYNSYDGGGYIQNLGGDKTGSINIINELINNKWIDRQTRAVFAEFTIFNPNINIYSYSIYLAEFSEAGGAFHWADTQSFKASTITDATGALSIIFYVVFLIIILVLTFKLLKKFRNDGCRVTITNFWNVLDLFLCCLSYAGTVIWICKFIYTKYAIDKYNEDKNAFVNFQHVVVWEYMFTCVLGGLCFTATLRILNALKYNRKLTEVAQVLQKGANPIFQFSLMFSVVFFDFVSFGYLLFGSTVHEYRNFFISFGSLTNTLIGRNSLDSMIKASPAFAELYFFVYVFFVIFTLMTVFAAILNESISEVRSSSAPDTVGIVKIVKTAVKDILGLVGIRMKSGVNQHTANKYSVNNARKSIDASNILGLIRETLDDFKAEGNTEENPSEEKCDKGDAKPANNNVDLVPLETEPEMESRAGTSLSVTTRPTTARNVTIVLPDGKEEFYDFYKGYI